MNDFPVVGAAVFGLMMIVVYIITRRTGRGTRGQPQRRRGGVGSAAMGSVYDLLSEDKRRAIEIIVEEKAEARRPEYPDGDLPHLQDPRARKRP